jgi:serine protease Do
MWSKQQKFWSVAGFILIGVLVGIVLTANFGWTPRGFAAKGGPPVLGSQDAPSEALLQLQNTSKAFTAVSKEVLPTVVSVFTTKVIKASRNQDNLPPMFREFFGRNFEAPQQEDQAMQGLGSGVIVSPDGYILTNNHVVREADEIKVQLYDKRTLEARLIGADPLTDVAVIKVDEKDLPVARLGDSDQLEIGEWVLAVGNPLNLSSTVTAGIVSAKGRSLQILSDQDEEASSSRGSYAIENFIQTDAAINPGNSGGALVNLRAEVIGINTAIATQTGTYMGYGFAIPIDLARKVMSDLIQNGYVTRAWLGIAMRPVDATAAERFGMKAPSGVVVEEVMDDSPARNADLQELDVILKINGKDMNSTNEVQNYIAMQKPGGTVDLTILRKGRTLTVPVKLGQRDTGKSGAKAAVADEDMPKLGLTVETLSSDLKRQYAEYRSDEGVLVTEVEPAGSAYDANIRRGDLITQIEDKPVPTLSEYRKVIRSFERGKVVIFNVKSKNRSFHAFVKLPK